MVSGLHHFKDKTLIVTGASTGTGQALALAREGGQAVFVGSGAAEIT